jgi:hypothetical protein
MNQGPRFATVTIRLQEHVLAQLDDLTEALSSSRERLLTSLIEREHAARARQLNNPAPWAIADSAIAAASRFMGNQSSDRERTRDVLETACVDAALAEAEGRRKPVQRSDGLWRYRGPKPQRFTLIVEKTVSGKATLIDVTRTE